MKFGTLVKQSQPFNRDYFHDDIIKFEKKKYKNFNTSKIQHLRICMYWELKILDFLKFLNN